MVPCVCLIFMIMIGHRLPPQSGERITLTIVICLTCIVMMEYTNSRILPQTSEVSFFSKVFLTVTLVASFSILETCYVLSIYHRGENMLTWMPDRLKKFILSSSRNQHQSLRIQKNFPNFGYTHQVSDENIITTHQKEQDGNHQRTTNNNDQGETHSDDTHTTHPATALLGQTSKVGQVVHKATLIYQEVKTYNENVSESSADSVSDVIQEENVVIAKFIDNAFIVISVTCVAAAVLTEAYSTKWIFWFFHDDVTVCKVFYANLSTCLIDQASLYENPICFISFIFN